MESPLLTVLMPVYNAEEFLREAIDSILNQTFTEFEFLIIDDGSTDSSDEIIRSYTDPRIRIWRNSVNSGISASLNKGIELAKAELIARMDADDISYPNRLQKQFDFFKSNPDCSLLTSWAREIDEDKNPLFAHPFIGDFYFYVLNFECWIYHPAVMYKKSAVIAVGNYSFAYCEDYDLWWKLTRLYKMSVLEEVLLDYRSTNHSLSRVTKHNEYEAYQHMLVARNVDYYTHGNIKWTDAEIEFLRCRPDNFLIETNYSLMALLDFFKKFKKLNRFILHDKNTNANKDSVTEASVFQKERLSNSLRTKISRFKLALLLILIGQSKFLIKILLRRKRVTNF